MCLAYLFIFIGNMLCKNGMMVYKVGNELNA